MSQERKERSRPCGLSAFAPAMRKPATSLWLVRICSLQCGNPPLLTHKDVGNVARAQGALATLWLVRICSYYADSLQTVSSSWLI